SRAYWRMVGCSTRSGPGSGSFGCPTFAFVAKVNVKGYQGHPRQVVGGGRWSIGCCRDHGRCAVDWYLAEWNAVGEWGTLPGHLGRASRAVTGASQCLRRIVGGRGPTPHVVLANDGLPGRG